MCWVQVVRRLAAFLCLPCSSWSEHVRLDYFMVLMCFSFTVLQQQKNLEGYVGFASLPNQVYRKSVKRGFEFTLMVVGKNTCCCVCPCFLWIMSLYLLRLAFRSPSVCVCVWICSAIFIHKGHVPQLCRVNWRVGEEGNILLLVCEWILMASPGCSFPEKKHLGCVYLELHSANQKADSLLKCLDVVVDNRPTSSLADQSLFGGKMSPWVRTISCGGTNRICTQHASENSVSPVAFTALDFCRRYTAADSFHFVYTFSLHLLAS